MLGGVPVVALLCSNCPDGSFVSSELVEFVANGVEKYGLDFWDAEEFDFDLARFHPECQKCQNRDPKKFTKERSVLDVWFDSSVSNFAVLKRRNLPLPCDVYFEGKDQVIFFPPFFSLFFPPFFSLFFSPFFFYFFSLLFFFLLFFPSFSQEIFF